MSFIDDSEKNVTRNFLRETTAAGGIGGFVGRGGKEVDKLFAESDDLRNQHKSILAEITSLEESITKYKSEYAILIAETHGKPMIFEFLRGQYSVFAILIAET